MSEEDNEQSTQPRFAVGEQVRIGMDYSHAHGWRCVVREIAPHLSPRGEVLTYKYHIQCVEPAPRAGVHFYVTEDHLQPLP